MSTGYFKVVEFLGGNRQKAWVPGRGGDGVFHNLFRHILALEERRCRRSRAVRPNDEEKRMRPHARAFRARALRPVNGSSRRPVRDGPITARYASLTRACESSLTLAYPPVLCSINQFDTQLFTACKSNRPNPTRRRITVLFIVYWNRRTKFRILRARICNDPRGSTCRCSYPRICNGGERLGGDSFRARFFIRVNRTASGAIGKTNLYTRQLAVRVTNVGVNNCPKFVSARVFTMDPALNITNIGIALGAR